jgi:dephospho-CoA kinase
MITDVMGTKKGAVKRPFIIGLTGGIASGKTTVSNLFHQHYDIFVVDADVVAREVVAVGESALQALVEHFGQAVLLADGSLDRAYLRSCIFSNLTERKWVNALLHPLIRQRMTAQLLSCHSDYALAVIPLLVETGIPEYIDFVLVVDCSVETQYQRLQQRDSITNILAKSILNAQASREQRLSFAQAIINNDGDSDYQQLTQQVSHWHQFFLTLID